MPQSLHYFNNMCFQSFENDDTMFEFARQNWVTHFGNVCFVVNTLYVHFIKQNRGLKTDLPESYYENTILSNFITILITEKVDPKKKLTLLLAAVYFGVKLVAENVNSPVSYSAS